MKLITALKIIEEREKRKRKAAKEMQIIARFSGRRGCQPVKNNDLQSSGELDSQKNLIHVQSVFSKEVIAVLKEKAKELYIKEAFSKAIYWYLVFDEETIKKNEEKNVVFGGNEIIQKAGNGQRMKFVHLQLVLPQEDVITLKKKTGESSVKEAIAKAVYYYLKFAKEEEK